MSDHSDSIAPQQPTDSAEELVKFLGDFVGKRYTATGKPVDGTTLAESIRKQFPERNYASFGFTRLADAVRAAEQRGLLTRHPEVRHLAVSPGPTSTISFTSSAPQPRFLRPEIWKALIFYSAKPKVIDRKTGRLLTEHAEIPTAGQDSEQQYRSIANIPAATQKAWMKAFATSQNLFPDAHEPIAAERWWTAFPEWLKNHQPGLEREWLAVRAKEVVEYATKWASDNQVPAEMLFTPDRPLRTPESFKRSDFKSESKPVPVESKDSLREAILSAVGQMSTNELVNIAVPIRCLLQFFKPL